METVTIILVLLLAVVVSGIITKLLPLAVPQPLVQIVLGAAIGLTVNWHVTLDPEIFFLVFLPPLLFLDGWRLPRDALVEDGKTIASLAFGLVVFTVLGMGLIIHWMIPQMPLPVSFALAAVISPTDPIAVTAIAQRVPIPKRMMRILSGEALLNDASGLVCLRFAIAAALTGAFSLPDAALEFSWLSVGGLAVGAAFTLAVGWVKRQLDLRFGEDSNSQIVISLLIPFGAYLIADNLKCSGILAAVAAGVTMGFIESSGQAMAITRIRRNTFWDVIQFAANGTIFVLLGEQLPDILTGAVNTVRITGHGDPWWLAIYVVAISGGLAVLRFIWVWVSFQLTLFSSGDRDSSPNWRIVAAMTVAGVRGAITLAGILTLPLHMSDGSAFPARQLAIFLAMGAIIISLIAATVLLPLLLKGLAMPADDSQKAEEDKARVAAAQAAMSEVARLQSDLGKGKDNADLYVSAASRVMNYYRDRIESYSAQGNEAVHESEVIERQMRLAAIRAERKALYTMARQHTLGNESLRKLVRELDLLEARYAG